MKNLLIVLVFLTISTLTYGQKIKWGPRIGAHTSHIKPGQLFITDQAGLDQFTLDVKQAELGFNAGLFLRVQTVKKFFVQLELHASMSSITYQLEDVSDTNVIRDLTETTYDLNLPVHIGLKFGPIRFQGGAIASRTLGGQSDVKDIVNDYEQVYNDLNIGWQAGIGADIGKITLDLRYEGDFGRYANHMEFFDERIAFDDRERLIKLSLGWKF